MPPAITADLIAIVRLEGRLPGKAIAGAKVAHQHPAVAGKALADFQGNTRIHPPHVGNGGLASTGGGRDGREHDFYRSARWTAELLVEKDTLVPRDSKSP